MNIRRLLGVLFFLTLVVAANVLTARYGMVPVGFGMVATAGTWAAGLVLLARDVVHDTAGRLAVLGCVAAGAALSAWLAEPQLAVASGAAFAVSELADLAVYEPLRRRGWARAVLASNAVGAVVDTWLFLTLAGFPVWEGTPGQLFAKATATAAVVGVVVMRRLRYAHLTGCHSADGTYLAHGPDTNLPKLLAWLRSVNNQGLLWEAS